jgi:hypothetical protein
MRCTPTQYATIGSYVLLGASFVVISACRAIEYANYWMKTPKDRMKQR